MVEGEGAFLWLVTEHFSGDIVEWDGLGGEVLVGSEGAIVWLMTGLCSGDCDGWDG